MTALTLAVGIVIFFPRACGPPGSHSSSQQKAKESCCALAAASWDAAWLPHSLSLTQGRHPCPHVSPAQSPGLALHFTQGLSFSPCLLLLLFHSWPLSQGSGGKLGTEVAQVLLQTTVEVLSVPGQPPCLAQPDSRALPSYSKPMEFHGNRRVSRARVQRTSGISDQVTERTHAQAQLSGKCCRGGWCECKPSHELCIPAHVKQQHIYASSFTSYHFTGQSTMFSPPLH